MEKVVVVDDDPDIVRVTETRLRAAGYKVLSATDGRAGLELIRAERPRVVLLDLMMPRMHGFAACQEIRNDPALDDVQIIVISAKSYPADIKKAREVGANSYLTKPYDLEELVAKVKEALKAAGPRISNPSD